MKKHQPWMKLIAVLAVTLSGTFSASAAVPRPEHPRPGLMREAGLPTADARRVGKLLERSSTGRIAEDKSKT